MRRFFSIALFTSLVAVAGSEQASAQHCYTSYGGTKPNKLYVYFPTVGDATYPEFGTALGVPATSPAHSFNIADLTNYASIGGTATAAALRDGIYQVVADTYCEFNVQVIQTATSPPTTAARRNTVAVTTDNASASGLFGLAQSVDTGDPTAVDFAYVWGATYQGQYGGAGGALAGAKSTLDRWARALGGTTAHEAGHNYGLSHNDGLPVATGEDVLEHHIMASGSHYSGEDRAGFRRHFSDHEYAVLAANVGLSVQTIWNWDFVNPNAQAARKLRIDILATQASLTVSAPYNGNGSPWINPTVSASLGTQLFQGVTYNKFQVSWSTGHAWDGHAVGGPGPATGVSGEAAGGASFHVGTGFSGVDYNLPNPIILTNVTLFDASNTALALHPRSVAFDVGAFDAADGTFAVQAMNVAGAPMRVDDVRVRLLPRLLAIDYMVPGAERLLDVRDQRFSALGEVKPVRLGRTLGKGQTVVIPIARLADARHVVERVDAANCNPGDRLRGPDVASCKTGINVSLFPATTTYLTAAVTDPSARYWDFKIQKYVTGPLTSRVFLQFVGRHPDLNKNGADDYIDILSRRSRDGNRDGIPDEVRIQRPR
jgi:hypothetical protein